MLTFLLFYFLCLFSFVYFFVKQKLKIYLCSPFLKLFKKNGGGGGEDGDHGVGGGGGGGGGEGLDERNVNGKKKVNKT